MTSRAPVAAPLVGVPFWPAAAFVLVWSSGYVAGPAGVEAVSPFWVLVLRFAGAALMLYPLARFTRGALRISREDLVRVAASGLVMNGLLFGTMYAAFELGLQATLGALLHSLSPVLTAVLAGVNSVLGLLLLGLLVRRGGAGASASVFFLMPPVTAVLAWVLLDERLTGPAVLGLALSTVGVAVATRRRA
ncbi:MAG: DMT family transporter [Nocardioides sp.]